MSTHNVKELQNPSGWRFLRSSPAAPSTAPCPHMPLLHIFESLQGFQHFPGQPVPVLHNPFGEGIFPKLNLLRPFPFVPSHLLSGRRARPPPGYHLLSGTCILLQGKLSFAAVRCTDTKPHQPFQPQ